MIKLLKYLKGHIVATVFAPISKLMEALFELIVPIIVAFMIDTIIPSGDTSLVYKYGIILLCLGGAGLLFSVTCQFLAARTSNEFGGNIRSSLYKHINKFSHAELDMFGADSLTIRLSNDVNNVQLGLAMFMRLVTRSPFIVIGSTIMSFIISPILSIIFLCTSIVIGFVLYLIMKKSSTFYSRIQYELDGVTLQVNENLTGTRVVRAFSRQDKEIDDFKNSTTHLSKTSTKAGIISALTNPLTYVITNIAIICVLWFGGIQVNVGSLTQGEVLALVNYLTQMFLSLVTLAMLVATFTKASSSAKRINQVLKTPTTLTYPDTCDKQKVAGSPKIVFENVDFSYQSSAENSLTNINFSLNDGETIGIIGATGSGKSTVASLVARFYDATGGRVIIDGHSIADYNQTQCTSKSAIVPQKTMLFYGTLRDNMLMGNPTASDEEITKAINSAQASDVLAGLSDGLDTIISASGKNLSGGQKQRLTIARALLKNADILVLDDSFSALDYATDSNLRKALKKDYPNTTTIFISQRASSIKNATKILVLDEGLQVGLGTHNELIKTCDVYKEIVLSQEYSTPKNNPKKGGNE